MLKNAIVNFFFNPPRNLKDTAQTNAYEALKERYFKFLDEFERVTPQTNDLRAFDDEMALFAKERNLWGETGKKIDESKNLFGGVGKNYDETSVKMNTKTKGYIDNLSLSSQQEFSDFVDSVLSKDYKNAPNIQRIATLKNEIKESLGLNGDKVFILKSHLSHFRPERKAKYNQALRVDEIKEIPNIINNATTAYKQEKGFFIPFDDTLNPEKVNFIHFTADNKGNFIITTKKVNKDELARVGVEPTTPKAEIQPLPFTENKASLTNHKDIISQNAKQSQGQNLNIQKVNENDIKINDLQAKVDNIMQEIEKQNGSVSLQDVEKHGVFTLSNEINALKQEQYNILKAVLNDDETDFMTKKAYENKFKELDEIFKPKEYKRSRREAFLDAQRKKNEASAKYAQKIAQGERDKITTKLNNFKEAIEKLPTNTAKEQAFVKMLNNEVAKAEKSMANAPQHFEKLQTPKNAILNIENSFVKMLDEYLKQFDDKIERHIKNNNLDKYSAESFKANLRGFVFQSKVLKNSDEAIMKKGWTQDDLNKFREILK